MEGFLIALQFLTRLSLKGELKISDESFGKSSLYFPLVGLVIGAILGSLAYLAGIFFQPLTIIIIVIAAEIILTGGLHLDGYMDTCDGLFSGRPQERMLEIMKDSRVGANSVTGLLLLILLKIGMFLEVPGGYLLPILVVMPVVGRWALVYTIWAFPYARQLGLGKTFKKEMKEPMFLATSLYSFLICLFVLPGKLLGTLPLILLSVHFLGARINRILNGHTGDTYGAICETSQVLFLFWCVLLVKI